MLLVLLINFGLISRQKFMKIHKNTPNYVYNKFLKSNLQINILQYLFGSQFNSDALKTAG
jgi:predicted transcriptional regulator